MLNGPEGVHVVNDSDGGKLCQGGSDVNQSRSIATLTAQRSKQLAPELL